MLASPRISRALAVGGAAAVIAGGLVATPAARAAGPTASVTVVLKAPDQAGLNHLATAHGLSHTQRVAALSTLLPSAAAHQAVSDELRANGFTVTHETAWTIDAQAPDRQVTALFGSSPAVHDSASRVERTQAASVLTRVPAAISSFTAAVLTRSNAPQVFHPHDLCSAQCHDGGDFRNAYSSTTSVLHKGNDANGALTIATLQFPLQGGWNPSDLTKYAASVGLPDPVASGQYTQIPVDGASVPAATTSEGGADEEVDLDQESILSTAPKANQRAYFDTNASKAGYADALSQVLADVTQGPGAVNGGDPKIAALSTSWGACESEFSDPFAFPHDTVKAVGNILKSLTAAGVTIFAASGDDRLRRVRRIACGRIATDAALAPLFDHDLLGAAMAEALAHGALLDARLERQGLGRDTECLVARSFRINHSAVLILFRACPHGLYRRVLGRISHCPGVIRHPVSDQDMAARQERLARRAREQGSMYHI